jgi:hypothetical protein
VRWTNGWLPYARRRDAPDHIADVSATSLAAQRNPMTAERIEPALANQ